MMPTEYPIEPILIDGRTIIDYYVTTLPSNRLVRRMLPVLVEMAKNHEQPITYRQLAKRIHHGTPQIGFQLGCIIDILEHLSRQLNTRIPQLAGLCVSAYTGLPGGSIDRIDPSYKDMSEPDKRLFLERLNQAAYNYDGWDRVLSLLGLQY